MTKDLPTTYEPSEIQRRILDRWLAPGVLVAVPDGRARDQRYVIMMPLPNVTGALHMGHAMDNVMQDLLIRWHRMQGENALWQPGTDHAGIATQAVIEKRLYEMEGKTRYDIGRDALVQRMWAWKDEYQQRIVQQQQQMGCSCDWSRQRFTMDPVCSAAVYETFFRLFRDGLIYRGDRLVNWDCSLQTAVADDEVYHESIPGHFWHLRYPVIDPHPGEPEHVVVATTRPETMLGDTAVACHPEPARAMKEAIEKQRSAVLEASTRDRPAAEAELARREDRERTHLPTLERLAAMARDGRKVLLPLMNREIPLILDEWAKPELASGCVKITPAHDPNDYDVWQRHAGEIGLINILEPDGTLHANAGPYAGLDRFEARKRVVEDLAKSGWMDAIEDRVVDVGHSDRSKSPIEPFVSRQWFVRTADLDDGIVCGRATPNEFKAKGLAQAAIDAVVGVGVTPTGRRLAFHPSRYAAQYTHWLAEKRDWCVSRQLWWGHRIPVWTATCDDAATLERTLAALPREATEELWIRIADERGDPYAPDEAMALAVSPHAGSFDVQVCVRDADGATRHADRLTAAGLIQDPDVLDTWFSSALWPFSTLGWPDPGSAPVAEGQTALGAVGGGEDSFGYYYPGSCLVTARDIITLWVARMLMLGLYNHGDVPFTDCFVHAKILDGRGVTMSKSKGNGIDPIDIIGSYGADAMRYVLCDMETGMQDVRLPVQATCPTCEALVELAEARHGKTIFTYLCTKCGGEFDVLGTMPDCPAATITSDRFEAGRNFCNKLWNAARFTLMNLGDHTGFRPLTQDDLAPEDRWILSRLNHAITRVTGHLENYAPSAALGAAREFFWSEFCDWYLELIKPRMRDSAQAPIARQVLAAVLDQVLRLFHPFVPFITEALWEFLGSQAPRRGISEPFCDSDLCIQAAWPEPDPHGRDEELEREFERLEGAIRRIRDVRMRCTVPPRKTLPVVIRTSQEAARSLERHAHLLRDQARVSTLIIGEVVDPPPNAATLVHEDMEIHVGDVLDPEKERARLQKQREGIEKMLAGSRAKLANESFVSRAPARVVEAERRRIVDLEGQLDLVEKNLQAL